MQLQSTFDVPAPPDVAFTTLLDLAQVASCMPGAELTGQDGDTFRGRLRLRIGPITAAYEGSVVVEESDQQAGRAVLRAEGSEVGGQGGASAQITATVREAGDGSRVEVTTDLDVRGRAAQFGRGVLGEVSQRLVDQFARNLEAMLQAPAGTDTPGEVAAAGGRSAEDGSAADARPSPAGDGAADAGLDVLGLVGGPLLRQVGPALVALLVGVVLGRRLGRRRPHRAPTPPWSPTPPWGPTPPWSPPAWPPVSWGPCPAPAPGHRPEPPVARAAREDPPAAP